MIPSKPEDFPAPHGGFEGEEEGLGDLLPGFRIKVIQYCRDLYMGYSTPTGWRGYRLTNILERIGPDQPPTDSL